jgi:hypothetical protein
MVKAEFHRHSFVAASLKKVLKTEAARSQLCKGETWLAFDD